MKLEKIVTYQKGKAPKNNMVSDGLILYLTPEYLRGNAEPTYVSDTPTKVNVNDGDLLLLWDGSNAGEFFKGRKGFLSSTMVKFHFDEEKRNRDFLYYQLKNSEHYLKSRTSGSGIPHVDKEVLFAIEIEDFEKHEQIRIAEILNSTDKTIKQTEKLIAKYQRIKTGLMQDLLTRGIDEHGNIRDKSTHKFVVKNGIEVPEEWEVSPTIQELYMKGRIGWQGLKASEFMNDGNYLVTGIHFTKDYKVDWKKCYRISDNRYNEAPEIQLKENDVLITKDGTIGKIAFIDSLPGRASLNSHLLVLRPLSNNILPKFILYSLIDSRFRYFIESIKSGSTLAGLTQTNFGKYNFVIPKVREQEKIISLLDEINNIIEKEINYLSKLNSLKTGLMQDLLSGRVRVKVEEDEIV